MVCLTSCVFRSIRFSGFARPHIGVRREGELYTQAQGEGKGGRGAPRDAHKSGNNSSLGAFPCLPGHQGRPPRPGKPAPAPRKSAYSASDPRIYAVLEARNRNAGYADRPSPLPARRRPEQPGSPAFDPDTGPPAKTKAARLQLQGNGPL